jgi:pimeloyl-ACP methyl ester carboxylesterase
MGRRIAAAFILIVGAPAFGQRTVSIPLPENTATIMVDVYGSGDRAVVLAHGGRFDKESWKDQAKVLANAGYMAVAVQFRGDNHNPDGTPGSIGSAEDNAMDVLAAIQYCHRLGAKTVSAIGGSFGGDAVADADVLSKPGEIDRIVLLGSAGGDHPEKLKARTLFLVARDDTSASSGPRLPAISAAYAKAPQPKKLVVVEGSAHAQFLFATSQEPSILKQILQFLSEP